LDSTNGDVLTYVGSANYFDEEIDGEVDMVRALRQPGSSIKPFIYALGVEYLGLTMDTPIFDLPLTVGGNTPQNSDGDFMGLMPFREALAYSRNIAPIKIFLALG
jgi:penicillin-binding protein 1C